MAKETAPRKFYSRSPEETLEIARNFASRLEEGTVVGLIGDLGAGKTCFAKGAISRLTGLPAEQIHSPTFTLVEEYEGRPKVYHVDLYRLEKPEETKDLPWDDLFGKSAITFIEWPEKVENLLSHCHFAVNFSKKDLSEREIEIANKEDR